MKHKVSTPEGRREFLRRLTGLFGANSLPILRDARAFDSYVNVKNFGAAGDGIRDDSEAFAAAFRKSSSVVVPEGRYLVGNLVAPSGLNLRGTGFTSMLVQKPESPSLLSINPGDRGTASTTDDSRHIKITDLHLHGSVVEWGFKEHHNLLNVRACTGFQIAHCKLSGFRGDAIYLGSGNRKDIERHNSDISITHCYFDGLNGDNRNAISVIDCVDLEIRQCAFANCSRSDMPGAIDIEPNRNDFHRIRRILIEGNWITSCTGGVGAICLVLLYENQLREAPREITIKGNIIDCAGMSNGITLRCKGDTGELSPDNDVVVADNEVNNSLYPLLVAGLRGVRVHRNRFTESTKSVYLSHPAIGRSSDVNVKNNAFRQLGRNTGIGVRDFHTEKLRISGNLFDDWGPRGRNGGVALQIEKYGPSAPTILDNDFVAPEIVVRTGIRVVGDRDATAAAQLQNANRFSDNVLPVDR